ncbi:MAG TPA: calcium-binding protein [Microvirga sp.]|nr:calcium-binding protein [Microvirga sp.]
MIDERVIRGDAGADFTLVTQADISLASSPDARGSETPAQRHRTVLDLRGRDPEEVWDLMVQHANNIDRANLPYGAGAFGTARESEVNSNTTVASVLHTVGIELAQNFPAGVQPEQAPLHHRLSAMLVDDVLVGGADADIILGGVGNDRLDGNAGNDRLFGEFGNDVLLGRSGNDLLDGGPGLDRMIGGIGNDTYRVDAVGDRVIETSTSPLGGFDRVVSAVSFALHNRTDLAGIERLTFVGSGNFRGTGNALDNVLIGNSGANALSGAAGDDVIAGRGGHDLLIGRSGDDYLRGGTGSDQLLAGLGRDRLRGESGADAFQFQSVAESLPGSARDVILDLSAADVIDLSRIDADASVAGNQSFRWIGTAAFSAAGQLRYESDGSGNTIVQAEVNGDLAADFEILLRDFVRPLGRGDFVL